MDGTSFPSPPPGGFTAVFMIGVVGDAYDFTWMNYTHDVAPRDLFDGTDNFSPAPFLFIPAADAQITDAGWKRVSDWNYTDDIWGCVVERASAAAAPHDPTRTDRNASATRQHGPPHAGGTPRPDRIHDRRQGRGST